MEALVFKTVSELAHQAKHYCMVDDDGSYTYVRRVLLPVKDLERISIRGWTVLKTYKDKIYIESEPMAFYPDSFKTCMYLFNKLEKDKH